MCLPARDHIPAIPAETVRVAQAAFPRGDPYLRLRDALGPIYADPACAGLFPKEGQPALAPAHLALVTIMQFAEGLSDRQAAAAVRGRVDRKYMVALELTGPGFAASVRSEFRSRLVAGRAEALLFETRLTQLHAQGLAKPRTRQRTDSTHVLAAIRVLNRLECVGEALRHALTTLASSAPDWLRGWVPPGWFDRYGRRFEAYRLPASKPERYALAERIGADGLLLLRQLDDRQAPAWPRQVPAVQTLRRVWLQQFHATPAGAPVRWRAAEDLPPAPLLITSPYDPDARWSKKRDTEWVGYKVHLTETGDDDAPHLLTAVETTLATTADTTRTATIHARLAERALLPAEHLVGTSSGTADHLVTSTQARIDLLGPVLPDLSWQGRANAGFGVAHFAIDWAAQHATCPQGHTSTIWKPTTDRGGRPVINIRFAHADCGGCPARTQCVQSSRSRALLIRTQEQHEALQAARHRLTTATFTAQYAARAGVEGTIAQATRRCALRQARSIGLATTRLQHLLIATALNVVRMAVWLAEAPLAQTRRPAFAALAGAPT